MLLGDAGVEDTIGETLPHRHQPGGGDHRGRDPHQVWPCRRRLGHRPPRDVGQLQLVFQLLPGGEVERAHTVELLQFVLDRRLVAVSLLGDHVDDDRPVVAPCGAEGLLEQGDVVTVDPPGVLEVEGVEDRERLQHLLDRILETSRQLVRRLADERQPPQHPAEDALRLLVTRVEAVVGEVGQCGETADRRRIGPPVVVEDDDEPLRPGYGNVVERLVGHAPGEGTVTDYRHRVAGIAGESVAQGVGERRRGVAVLHEVVLRLLPTRVSRQPAGVPQVVEPGHAAGDQLVDVGLMTDIPDETVARGVEHPMQGQGELDHAQVRGEMAPGLGNLVQDERPNLVGQCDEVVLAEPTQVGGARNGLQNGHGKASSG